MAVSTEITIVHGDTRRYTLSDITDDDGDDVDLSTGTLSFIVKEYVMAPYALFIKDSGAIGGIDIDDTVINQAELEITADDLAGVANDWSTLPYELRFLRDGELQTPLKGVLRVSPGFDTEES